MKKVIGVILLAGLIFIIGCAPGRLQNPELNREAAKAGEADTPSSEASEQEIPAQIKESDAQIKGTDTSIKGTNALSENSQPTEGDTNNPAGISPQEESKESEQEKISVSHWKRVFAKALAEINCPAPPKRNFSDKYYKGPMIDTHIHIQSLPDGAPGFPDEFYTGSNLGIKQSIAEWVCMMDYEETNSSFAFFAVWDPIRDESLEIVKRILEAYPGRFIPFIMPPDRDGDPDGYPTVDAKELEGMLQVYPGLFKGYGEIGLYGHPGGAPALPPDSPRLMEIYPVVQKSDLLVYVHLGEGQKESFERALQSNPSITFIFHGDQLIDCGSCDKTLDDVADILENHPNVYYGIDELYGDVNLLRQDVSKEEFIAHFNDYGLLLKQDLAKWKDFIETHPNQVLWGTDRGVGSVWSIDPEVAIVLNNYTRYFIGHLDPAVQERFAYKNAKNLLGEAS